MAHAYDTLISPAIEDLIERTESKFVLVALASKRCREITNYKLGSSIGSTVPPQVVASESAKYLSIALEEIAAGKIEAVEVDEDAEEAEDAEWFGVGDHLTDVGGQEPHHSREGSIGPAPGA